SPANRRTRKLWARQGVLENILENILATPCEEPSTKWGERLMFELDLLHGRAERDLSPPGTAHPSLLRLALDSVSKGWVGGPPCRARSMLRHLMVEGLDICHAL
ncbi:unnamed protein product, partial [Cladocopium goreaui]